MSKRTLLLLLLVILVKIPFPLVAEDEIYLDGVEPKWHKFFIHRTRPHTPVDPRLTNYLGENEKSIRSFALVISINEYPNFEDPLKRKFQPAKDDLDHLKEFLRRQQFDEVIVLENADATKDNIDHFLDNYLIEAVDKESQKSRVLIAYTGHGADGRAQGDPGYIALGSARNDDDLDNLYKLTAFEGKIRDLSNSAHCFQLLALINSCKSGGFFTQSVPAGGNSAEPRQSGAHAITATKPDDLAYALPGKPGSLFFNVLIDSVDSGQGDKDENHPILDPQQPNEVQGGGIIRFAPLASHLSYVIDHAGDIPGTHDKFSTPFFGAIKPVRSDGALFFLGPPLTPLTRLRQVPPSANGGSFITGVPDSIIFNDESEYQVLGVDVSEAKGDVDWPEVAKVSRMEFAYLRCSSGVQKDSKFQRNLLEAMRSELKWGAYHEYNPALPAGDQISQIRESVPADAAGLPFVIRLPLNFVPKNDAERKNLQDLKGLCSQYFGRPTVLYGGPHALADLVAKGDPYWIGVEDPSSAVAGQQSNLSALTGKGPWTMWQFDTGAKVKGIQGLASLSAFFGTPADLGSFRNGHLDLIAKASGERVLKIGVVGTWGEQGVDQLKTFTFACDEINKDGGVLGWKLRPVMQESLYYTSALMRLAKIDKVAVTFGELPNYGSRHIDPILEEYNGLLFSPSQFTPEFGSRKRIFSYSQSPSQLFVPAVDYLLSAGRKRFYLIGAASPSSRGMLLQASEYLISKGVPMKNIGGGIIKKDSGVIESVGTLVPDNFDDYTNIIEGIKGFAADGKATILSTLQGSSASAFFRAYQKEGLSPKEYPICSLTLSPTDLLTLPPQTNEGQLIVGGFVPGNKTDSIVGLARKFGIWSSHNEITPVRAQLDPARFEVSHGTFSVPFIDDYNSVFLWKAAVEKAHSFDSTLVTKVLEEGVSIQGPLGVVSTHQNHLVGKNIYIGEGKADGQFKILKEYDNVRNKPILKGSFKPKD